MTTNYQLARDFFDYSEFTIQGIIIIHNCNLGKIKIDGFALNFWFELSLNLRFWQFGPNGQQKYFTI